MDEILNKKICTKCKQSLLIDNFYFKCKEKRGRNPKCKACVASISKNYRANNREKLKLRCKIRYQDNKNLYAQYQKDQVKLHPEKFKDTRLRSKYGISLVDYNNMLDEQNHSCQICKKHKDNFTRGLVVDHNHNTEEVRGLLCSNCNSGMGKLMEDIEVLKNTIEYLKKYNK